jgi:hypothetical protein
LFSTGFTTYVNPSTADKLKLDKKSTSADNIVADGLFKNEILFNL